MSRNREIEDALDELKMLHDAKNHDYATAENPYKNLEGVERLGIEAWRGVVIRLMDKFKKSPTILCEWQLGNQERRNRRYI